MKSAMGFNSLRLAAICLLLALLAPMARADNALPAGANKTCPVMTDQPTRADRFIDYNGRRIFFCCDKCMAKFQRDPEKYVAVLDEKTTTTSGVSASAGMSSSSTPISISPNANRFRAPLWQLFGRLHVVIVHFPIALIILAGMIELFRIRKQSPSDVARFCLTLGAIAAVMAACMGWVDATNQFPGNAPRMLTYHRWLGVSLAAASVLVTGLAFIARKIHSQRLTRGYRLGVIFCAAGVGVVGHFGGMLTYGNDYFTEIFKTSSPQTIVMTDAKAQASTPIVRKQDDATAELQQALLFGTAQQARDARIKLRLVATTAPPTPPVVSLPTDNPIDQFIVAKWESAKLPEAQHPPEICDDATFSRRVYLDVIGMIPTIAESQQFVADKNPDKRAKLIDDLLARNDDYAANLTPWFEEGIASTNVEQEGGVRMHGNYRPWILECFRTNRPYDVMVAQLIDPTEPGYIKRPPVDVLGQKIPVGYVLNDTHKDTLQTAANFGQFFLGTGMKCASCHSHFLNPDEWPQARFTAFASMFCPQNLELIRCEKPSGKFADANYPFPIPGAPTTMPTDVNQRLHLVACLTTDPANPRFARTIVNRLWRRYLGLGLFEPIDDYRLDSPAANPELLDWLAYDFVEHGYDLKHTIRLILNSRTYQLKYDPKLEDHFDLAKRDLPRYWRSPSLRKLTAEQLIDSIRVATSQEPLPDTQRMYHQTESTDLSRSLGRPSSREEVATARPDDVAVVQSLELMNGAEWSGLLYRSPIVDDLMYQSDPVKVAQTLYEAAFSRPAGINELTIAEQFLKSAPATQPAQKSPNLFSILPPESFMAQSIRAPSTPPAALGDMLWALVTSPEFQYVH